MKNDPQTFPVPDCRKFTGYKPCQPYTICPCEEAVPHGEIILIINLDFIGDVMMTTALLPALKRKYPESTIHWITRGNALPVLQGNPYLFRVWEWNAENRMVLRTMKFDTVLNADKNQDSGAFTMSLRSESTLGFGINRYGAVIPLNPEADYNYRMGLDDELKFKKNRRTGLDILAQTWKLDYKKDEYVLNLSDEELAFYRAARERLGIPVGSYVIGLNTGCSLAFPLKRLSVEQLVSLAERLAQLYPEAALLLLGGREDAERNRQIRKQLGDMIIETPTDEGLRRGILYENLCDLVLTGDTLGMHLAIGLKKQVVAWFTISCGVEIELYGRGEVILSDLECSPCWRKQCEDPRCLQEFDLEKIIAAVQRVMVKGGIK